MPGTEVAVSTSHRVLFLTLHTCKALRLLSTFEIHSCL